ncbi:MAG: asparagine synthase-related protein [Candidatus Hodarchaeota archaeon]
MTGICGIAEGGKYEEINQMLDELEHRGGSGRKVIEINGATFGIVFSEMQENLNDYSNPNCIEDAIGQLQYARACYRDGSIILERDPLGITPLYFGHDSRGTLYFASEVKALIDYTSYVNQVPPGHRYNGARVNQYFNLTKRSESHNSSESIAKKLFRYLDKAISKYIELDREPTGCWLSGGLDSSAIAALAKNHLETLYTFSAGLSDSPDIKAAREVAEYIRSEHFETIVRFNDLLKILPKVIYHLESFDALLVRSSTMNFIVAQSASKHVNSVFSGEGADELFAGYAYLKSKETKALTDELIDITNRLHDTALQRVDRSATAYGTVAYVPFLDSDVVNFAFCIPNRYKVCNNVEKWILRKSMEGSLPKSIINRTKAKFWKGAGVEDRLAEYIEEQISDQEFESERKLMNGWILNTKEELFYYRIFQDRFGKFKELNWIGRTKGAPKT